MRRLLATLAVIFIGGAGHSLERFSERDLVFLTRSECVNTPLMRSRLNDALKALALPTTYALIDADKLRPSDRRRGYGTPTVLYRGRELFGMAAPTASPNSPS